MRARLTSRQAEILAFIREWIGRHGIPPTLREIGERFELSSTNGIHQHLVALEKKGRIRRDGSTYRGIRLTDGGPCPMCGAKP